MHACALGHVSPRNIARMLQSEEVRVRSNNDLFYYETTRKRLYVGAAIKPISTYL
jgi:hypothetical protein